MNYIIVDFEFNQAYDFEKDQKMKSNPDCPFEIIQIGAVKLDKNFTEIGRFSTLIKPIVYPKLNPYVSKITSLTDEDFNNDTIPTFDKALKDFFEFCGEDRPVFCVWGKNDISTLFINVEYHKITNVKVPIEFINIQDYASKKLKHFSGTQIGLKNAIEQLEIDLGISYHDALNDALYTAEVFKYYKQKRIPIAKYAKPKPKPSTKKYYSKKRKNRNSNTKKQDTKS